MMGDSPESAFPQLEAAGACILGANCTHTSHEMLDLVPLMQAVTDLPLLIRPNAGNPVYKNGNTSYQQKPLKFGEEMKQIHDTGVQCLGGCCGTTPAFIRTLPPLKE